MVSQVSGLSERSKQTNLQQKRDISCISVGKIEKKKPNSEKNETMELPQEVVEFPSVDDFRNRGSMNMCRNSLGVWLPNLPTVPQGSGRDCERWLRRRVLYALCSSPFQGTLNGLHLPWKRAWRG